MGSFICKSLLALSLGFYAAILAVKSARAQIPPADIGQPAEPQTQQPQTQQLIAPETQPHTAPTSKPRPSPPWQQNFVRLDEDGAVFELRYRPPGQRRTLLRARCVPQSNEIALVINPDVPGNQVPSQLIFSNKIGAGLIQLRPNQTGVQGTKIFQLDANHDLWFSLIKGNRLSLMNAQDGFSEFADLSLKGSALPIRTFLQECLPTSQKDLPQRLRASVRATAENAHRVVIVKQPLDIKIDSLNMGSRIIAPSFKSDRSVLFEVRANNCEGQVSLTRQNQSVLEPIDFCAEDKINIVDLSNVDFKAAVPSLTDRTDTAPQPEHASVPQANPPSTNAASDHNAAPPTLTQSIPGSGLQFALSHYRAATGLNERSLNLLTRENNQLVLQAVCLPTPQTILAQTSLTQLPQTLKLTHGNPIMLRVSVASKREVFDQWDKVILSAANWQAETLGFLTHISSESSKELRFLSSTHDPLWRILSLTKTLHVRMNGLNHNKLTLPENTAPIIHQFLQFCRTPNFDPLATLDPQTPPPLSALDSCDVAPLIPSSVGVKVQTNWHNMRETPIRLTSVDAQRNTIFIGEVKPGHLTSFTLFPNTLVRVLDTQNQCIGLFVPNPKPVTFTIRQQHNDSVHRFTRFHYKCADNKPLTIDFDTQMGIAYVSRAGFEPFHEVSYPQLERYVHGQRELIGDGQFYDLIQNNTTVTKCSKIESE